MRTLNGVEIEQLAPGLRLGRDGVWRGAAQRQVSYPPSGYEECFVIEDESYWFAHRNAVISDLLRRHPPAGPLFDVGGGNGAVSKALVGAGWEVVLVEPGVDGVRNAKRRGIANVIEASFEDVGFRDCALAAVGIFDVLEHIEDADAFLTRLARALEPGGRLYLTVPAHRWLWSAEDVYAGHFRRFRARGLADDLGRVGLVCEWRSHFFAPLPLPILLARTLPSLLRSGRNVDVATAQAQHRAGSRSTARVLLRLLAAERAWLARGRTLPIGSSLLAVARKGGGE